MGMTDPVLGLAAALLILGDAGCFFEKNAQFFRFGFDQAGNHALLDNRVAAWTQSGAEEDIGNIAAPAFGIIQIIIRRTIA